MTTVPKINNDSESRRLQRNMTDTQKRNSNNIKEGKLVNAFVKDGVIIKSAHNDNGSYDYTNLNADIPASMPLLFGVSGSTAQIAPIIKNASVKDTIQSSLTYELLIQSEDIEDIILNFSFTLFISSFFNSIFFSSSS